MARPARALDLKEEHKKILEKLSNSREGSHSQVVRSRILLRSAEGEGVKSISEALDINKASVGLWRKRWWDESERLEGLLDNPKRLQAAIEVLLSDRPRPGSPVTFSAEQVCRIVALGCEKPPPHLSHWTHADLAREAVERGIVERISTTSIGRFLKSGGVKTPSEPILAQS